MRISDWSSDVCSSDLPASLNLRATRYGKMTMVHPTTPSLDAEIDPKVIFDLELGMELRKGIKLTAGANNLFNIYPDKLPVSLQANGFSLYNQYSPYGASGGRSEEHTSELQSLMRISNAVF